MDDVSRLIQSTVLTVNGADYLVGAVAFEDWSAIQTLVMRERNARMLSAIESARESMGEQVYFQWKREALEKIAATVAIPMEQWNEVLQSPEGMAMVAWVLIERRYPGKVSRVDCEKAVNAEASSSNSKAKPFMSGSVGLMVELMRLMGYDVGPNEIGQSNETGKTESTVPGSQPTP